MSASVLVSGRLYRAPERRECRNGKTMATATIKVIDNNVAQWWSVTTFGAVADELLFLDAGDAASFAGRLEATLYQSNAGETKVNLKVIADRMIALSPRPASKSAPAAVTIATPPRRRAMTKRATNKKPLSTPARDRPIIDDDLNDAVPW